MANERESRNPTTSKNKSDLETLSLNYLRSQNISQISDDDRMPKFHLCKFCSKAMFRFQFEVFTILRCGHLLHRLCVEMHIIRGKTKFPSCPICKADIEILKEELLLASGEYDILPRSYDKGKAS
ncbi:11608_t:CDS:1 [Diversispora eburnea]|uniref:11608_t:CDS:1 n=1 Tax=Diversispora eburnea TaxID=1213867 RepID=A0A9N9G6A1_9GLOM|nr:11608_t:CDS:1 [Diversispora eburnea]